MRNTSDRRQASGVRHRGPDPDPPGDRLVRPDSPWISRIPLHPDHEINAARARALGLVTRHQIATRFGVSYETVAHWARDLRGWPGRKARLQDDGVQARPDLYSWDEVLVWVATYRRKYLAGLGRGGES